MPSKIDQLISENALSPFTMDDQSASTDIGHQQQQRESAHTRSSQKMVKKPTIDGRIRQNIRNGGCRRMDTAEIELEEMDDADRGPLNGNPCRGRPAKGSLNRLRSRSNGHRPC